MLKLYHMPIAICAQKVRVCLAEKGVKWESHDAQRELRSPEYLQLNPGGYVPTLVHDDRVITESRIISEYVDEAFDGPALQPRDAYQRARMRLWTKQLDDTLFPCIYILSFVAVFREQFLSMPSELRQRMLPLDFTKRERTLNMLELGWDSPYVVLALERFAKMVADMERTLTDSMWLAGENYTLADADHTPYLQRLTDIGAGWLFTDRPALTRWFERVQARPSFSAVIADWISAEARAKSATVATAAAPKFRAILAAAQTEGL
jgi:glutathione S-transferase